MGGHKSKIGAESGGAWARGRRGIPAGMTAERESDQPNEYGFAGGATAPEPQPDRRSQDEIDGEAIAVPSGDLTGAVTEAIEETVDHRHDEDE